MIVNLTTIADKERLILLRREQVSRFPRRDLEKQLSRLTVHIVHIVK